MGAIGAEEHQFPGQVSEEHQLFAKDFHGHGNIFDFVSQRHGPPKATEIVSARCVRSDPNDLIPRKFARFNHEISPVEVFEA
jgi:hypothetical protein